MTWLTVMKYLFYKWLRICSTCKHFPVLSSFMTELPTLPEHLSSPPVFSGVRVTPSLVLYVCFFIVVCPFVIFLLAIVLSVLLRYTVSDCPFGIFKLFLLTLGPNYVSNTRSLCFLCSYLAIIYLGRPSLRLRNLWATWSGTSSSIFRISLIKPFTTSCVFSSTVG